jgi:hypothetical protein
MTDRIFEDAFNLLCGAKLNSGVYRDVFECRLRPELVVKVERERDGGRRSFNNVLEMRFWDDWCQVEKVRAWLAPCEYLSPDGRILLQRKVSILQDTDDLPSTVPEFLTDLKPENFGIYQGRIVCADYASTITNASLRRKRAEW